jgi:hypothetical protein
MEIHPVTPSQLAQHEAWQEARKRLWKSPPKEKPTMPSPLETQMLCLVPPVVDPVRDLMDFTIAAVANVAGMPVNEILAGPPTIEVRSVRNLAMALCVRRMNLKRKVVGEYFEVQDGAIVAALHSLDPILIQFAISNRTPLELTLPVIWGQWGKLNLEPTIQDIQRAVCKKWKVLRVDLLSGRRTAGVAIPRQTGMAISKRLTGHSLPIIGRSFKKDHTTVLYAVRKFASVMAEVDKRILPAATVEEWVREVFEEVKVTPAPDPKNRQAR